MLDVMSVSLMLLGFLFLFVGTLGLIRLPDTYTRLHATAKCDTLGSLLVVLGCVLTVTQAAAAAKLVAIAVFLWIVNPATTHMIARVARATGVPMIASTRHITRGEAVEGSDTHAR